MHALEKKIYLGLLVCLLVASIGVSFAYFTTSVSFGGKGANTNIETTDFIKVQYDAGESVLNLVNAVPNDYTEKSFSISVIPTNKMKSVTYVINLDIDNNSFVKCKNANYNVNTNNCELDAEELVYSLKDESGIEVAAGNLLEITGTKELLKVTKLDLTDNQTYEYTLRITYKNTGKEQNHNAGKTFNGSVNVGFAE